jgi:hypothetical protein
MREYLGGPWGEVAAMCSPPALLALAKWLEREADDEAAGLRDNYVSEAHAFANVILTGGVA